MRHFKTLLKESKNLEVFEVIRSLNQFISDKGVKASVQKNNECFDIYISGYANDEAKQELSESQLLGFFNGLKVAEKSEVVKTNYGYRIIMVSELDDPKLMEAYKEESQQTFKCCICGNEHPGYGGNPWPISTKLEDRACRECTKDHVAPARLEKLRKESVIVEAEQSEIDAVENETSNTVLDSRYIWVFAVLDEQGNYIDENIPYISDAIEALLDDGGTFLIAFPYVDPKPSDPNVGLVFADDPGPITLYNREQAKLNKDELGDERAGSELDQAMMDQAEKEQELAQESTVTESDDDDDVLVCAACGEEPNPDTNYCRECGEYVEPVPRSSISEESAQTTTIQVLFNEDNFKNDNELFRLFNGDFNQYISETTALSVELAELDNNNFSWTTEGGTLTSKELPLEEAKELVNRLRRDFQVEAEIKLSETKEVVEAGEDYYVTINFKESFYENVTEEQDVMDFYKDHFKIIRSRIKESEGKVPSFYYEGSTDADYYTNLMTEIEAQKVASYFKDVAEIEIKKVEV